MGRQTRLDEEDFRVSLEELIESLQEEEGVIKDAILDLSEKLEKMRQWIEVVAVLGSKRAPE